MLHWSTLFVKFALVATEAQGIAFVGLSLQTPPQKQRPKHVFMQLTKRYRKLGSNGTPKKILPHTK